MSLQLRARSRSGGRLRATITWRAPVMGPSTTDQTPEEATTHRKQRLLTQKQWFTWCAQLLWAQVSTKTSHLAPEGSNDDSSETATTHLASSCFGPKWWPYPTPEGRNNLMGELPFGRTEKRGASRIRGECSADQGSTTTRASRSQLAEVPIQHVTKMLEDYNHDYHEHSISSASRRTGGGFFKGL